jgi:hypothetical protein
LAVIGPGSEWLWTALQFFALSITGLAIFRQLRAQALSNSLTAGIRLADEFRVELIRFKLASLMDVSGNSRTMTPAIEKVGGWFDGTAGLIEHGYIPARMVWQQWGEVGQTFWAVFRPALEERRKIEPGLWKDWEHWLDDVVDRDRKAGTVRDLSPSYLARWIPETIAYYIASLRLEEEAKHGVIPTWPVPEPSSGSTGQNQDQRTA